MMLFENLAADCVQQTDNHVRYRETSAFKGNTLLVRGVRMENYEIKDSMLYQLGDSLGFGGKANRQRLRFM